jgi:hypothetical protein
MNLANPIFEFHVIIDNGIDVIHQAKVTIYTQYPSKVLVHIFDPYIILF